MSAESRMGRFISNIHIAVTLFFRAPPESGRRPAWPPHGKLALGALVAIVIVGGAALVLDARSVAGARALPRAMIWTFQYITDLGLSGWFLIPTAMLLLAVAAADTASLPAFSRRVLTATSIRIGFIFMAVAVPGLFVTILKRLVGRARPFVAGDDTWTSQFLVWRPDYASFPSGHATTAFAAAIAIGALWPRLRPVMWIYAVIIALSRVIITAHHPSDVIAGAIAGTIGALLVRNWYASRRLGFAVATGGMVFKLPGPSSSRIRAVAQRLVSA